MCKNINIENEELRKGKLKELNIKLFKIEDDMIKLNPASEEFESLMQQRNILQIKKCNLENPVFKGENISNYKILK